MTLVASGIFDTIGGLPMHPLFVHFAVVLVPLAAFALLALLVRPRLVDRYGWVLAATLVIGTGTAVLASVSGEALAHRVGDPGSHSAWAGGYTAVAIGLTLLTVAWLWLRRRQSRNYLASDVPIADHLPRDPQSAAPIAEAVVPADAPMHTLLRALIALLAVAALALAVIVGHTGARATWADAVGGATSADSSTAAPTPATPGDTITMADVAAHATSASCWTAIKGNVYDLTAWIARHPGGPGAIEHICGSDATTQFDQEHGNQTRPNTDLATYRIGALSQ